VGTPATLVARAGGAARGKLRPMIKHRRLIAILSCVTALGVTGTAAAGAADGATDIKVTAAPTLTPGQKAPFDAAGVRSIRRGKPIPAGYRLIGQQVEITRGAKSAGAALTFRCPSGKTLRTFGIVGNAGFSAVNRDYPGHRQTQVVSFAPPTLDHAVGTVYAVCR
jgi:hypothetical protein